MLNQFRHVTGDVDGHNTWQCLKCREKFGAPSTHNWKFCPLCGTAWDSELKWEEPEWKREYWRRVKHMANPYTWVIQERRIFRSCDGECITEWQDTYRNLEAWLWGKWTTAKDVLDMWKTEIGCLQADLTEEQAQHIRYCEHMGKDEPFHPFSIGQLRLVVRKPGQPDKIVKEYLPVYQEEPASTGWLGRMTRMISRSGLAGFRYTPLEDR